MSARDSWPVVVSARRMRGILSQRSWDKIWVRAVGWLAERLRRVRDECGIHRWQPIALYTHAIACQSVEGAFEWRGTPTTMR